MSTKYDDNFDIWNGTSIAHMFIRLITKTHHPFGNDERLSSEHFTKEYNTLQQFIKWHETHPKQYMLYNFTQDSMNELLNRISYDVDNKDELLQIWNTTMVLNF